jgi:thiol-disulfide isomerase/thioredoxin
MKIRLLPILLLISLCGFARKQPTVWWDAPHASANSHLDGYFSARYDVTQVTFGADETVVRLNARMRPEYTFSLDSTTRLRADGISYTLRSIDSLAVGAKTRVLHPDGLNLTLRFDPLPASTASFDLLTGDAGQPREGDISICGIVDAKAWANAWQLPMHWRNTATGAWEIGFFEEGALYDCRFWSYKAQSSRGDTHRLTLTDGREKLEVSIGKAKRGVRLMTIGDRRVQVAPIAGRTLPSYPATAAEPSLRDSEAGQTDSVTFAGWLRHMPASLAQKSNTYPITIRGLYDYRDNRQYHAALDSLGRFCIKIPLSHAQEATFDWSRTFIRMPLEPGATYFLLYDFEAGQKLVMGSNARLQNELLAFPMEWTSFEEFPERRADEARMLAHLAYGDSIKRAVTQRLAERLTAHPALSKAYADYVGDLYNTEVAHQLMQDRYLALGYRLPAPYVDYLNASWRAMHEPRFAHRDFSRFFFNYITMLNEPHSRALIERKTSTEQVVIDILKSARALCDSLGLDAEMRDIYAANYLTDYLYATNVAMPESFTAFIDSAVQTPAARSHLLDLQERYLAIEDKALRSKASLKSSDAVAGMSDGEAILRALLEPMKGKIVLIDVWGTWCSPCKAALSHFAEQAEELKEHDMAYLFLANNSTDEAWRNVIAQYGVTGDNVYHYNLPAAQQAAVERFLQVQVFPTYKLADRDGNILDLNISPFGAGLREVVEKIND